MKSASRGGRRAADSRAERPVYVISVAAELCGAHPQTLRLYERKGLIEPQRTEGGSRRYSDSDIQRLRRIQELTAEGLSLSGVRRFLELEERLQRARGEVERLHRMVGELRSQQRRGRELVLLEDLRNVRPPA